MNGTIGGLMSKRCWWLGVVERTVGGVGVDDLMSKRWWRENSRWNVSGILDGGVGGDG